MDLINSPDLYESTQKPDSEKDRLRVAGKKLAIGVDYDLIVASYPSNIVEEFVFSLEGERVLGIRVTYLTSAKRDLDRAEVF